LRTDYFHHVALAVAHRIDLRWPAAPGAPPGPSLLLVGALGDGVGDPPLAQQPTAGGVAVAPVGDQVRWALARATRRRAGYPDGVQQRAELGALVPLAGGDQCRQRPAAAVAGQVQLGGEPAAAAPQGLVAVGIGA
jgi:hypothetical protein